jgi:hypothetical protein
MGEVYDPEFLRRSPLYSLINVTEGENTPVALQRLLEDAVHKLNPKKRDQASAPAQIIDNMLAFRYLQQFGQKEVADQQSISRRQLAREQLISDCFGCYSRLNSHHRLSDPPA